MKMNANISLLFQNPDHVIKNKEDTPSWSEEEEEAAREEKEYDPLELNNYGMTINSSSK